MNAIDITKALQNPLNNIFQKIGTEFRQSVSNRLVEYQVEEYRRNFFSKNLLHRSIPKPLIEFYEPLFISRKGEFQMIATDSCRRLFEKRNYITLIGSAGCGKSTIVKYLFTNCFKEKYRIPIKIELRYLNDYPRRFHDYVFDEIFHFQKLGLSVEITDRLLSTEEFIFFLDGYDELNSKKREIVTKDIDSFVSRFPKIKYLITTRPYTQLETLPLFENYEVLQLQKKEIESFIRKQIPKSDSELATKITEAVNKKENASYEEYLSNPLLLSMFILTFQSYSSVPAKRSSFYDQVFDTLFSVHDSISKLAFVREKESGLSKENFKELLELFCFLSFFEETFLFSSNYMNTKLNIIKQKKSSLKFDNSKLLEDLQIAIGIISQEGLDFTFPHKSLQEYFAAVYISRLSEKNKIKVYTKILKSLNLTLHNNKEHFYLLLAELDELSLIEYVIIPFMETIQVPKKINSQEHLLPFKTLKSIDQVTTLYFFYTSFNSILDSEEIFTFYDELNYEFDRLIMANSVTGRARRGQLTQKIRENLVFNMVNPFMIKFSDKMKAQCNHLKEYLIRERGSDDEIIDMID